MNDFENIEEPGFKIGPRNIGTCLTSFGIENRDETRMQAVKRISTLRIGEPVMITRVYGIAGQRGIWAGKDDSGLSVIVSDQIEEHDAVTRFKYSRKKHQVFRFIVPTKPELFTEEARQERVVKIKKILSDLGSGFPLSWE